MGITVKTKDKSLGEKLKNKGGAPKKRVRRDIIMRIRMTATNRFKIETKAKEAGMAASSWIRAAALSSKITPRLTPDERRIIWMLAELANNLNQLTKLAHQVGLLTVVRKLDQLLKEIDETFKLIHKNDRESDNG
jgi:hypothetical protein